MARQPGRKLYPGEYWYKIHIVECPVCGRGYKWRERQYISPPEDYRERYYYEQVYDYCDV